MRRCPYCHHSLDHVEVVHTEIVRNAVFSGLLAVLFVLPLGWWALGHPLLGAACAGGVGLLVFYAANGA